MRRWTTVLAFLAAPTWAQDAAEEEGPEEETGEEVIGEDLPFTAPEGVRSDPEMPGGVIVRGERDAPALFVRVREAGVLQVKAGEEWKDTTLEGLSARLREFAEEQDREMQKDGKSAYTMAPDWQRISRLFLSIDAEPTVPWQHVQWVMVMAVEQKYYKLEFSDGKRRLLASVPLDRGIRPIAKDPPVEIKVGVHAVARAETVQKWGDVEVSRPTEIRFKMGGQVRRASSTGSEETVALEPVADFIRWAKKSLEEEEMLPIGEIKAGHKVPFSKILDVMETFEAAGLARVNFFGTALPEPELRAAPRLPYPAKNY